MAKQHVDVPIPKPQAEEILVKVEVAGVNPLDWRLQEGLARPILPRKFPFVPGLFVAFLPITIIVLKRSMLVGVPDFKCENLLCVCVYKLFVKWGN